MEEANLAVRPPEQKSSSTVDVADKEIKEEKEEEREEEKKEETVAK